MSATDLTVPRAVRTRVRTRRTRRPPAIGAAPWTPGDRAVTATVIGVGGVVILIAWLGASGTTDWDTQLGWTALAMLGVVVVCTGVGIWLFRGFARVRTETRVVRRELAARIAGQALPAVDLTLDRSRVYAPGMAHHHRPDCLLVAGKRVVAADEAALPPCGVCGVIM